MEAMVFSGLTNPKRVIERRLEETDDEFLKRQAEAKAAAEAAVAAAETRLRFGKGYSPAERADQQAKLAEMLKKRK